MSKQPLISVVLPTYNDKDVLAPTIDSVLQQSYSHLECIVVDDGSTDGTSNWIQEHYKDERIKVITLEKNLHICYALNVGLSAAKGEYIARIDSGDQFEPNKLELQLLFMQEHPECGACFTWANLIDCQGRNINEQQKDYYNLVSTQKNRSQREWIQSFIQCGNFIAHPSALIRGTVLEEVGKYNIAYVQGQDYDLWLRIAAVSKLHILEKCLVKCQFDLEKDNKISVPNQENDIRFFNERVSIISHFFDSLSKEQFIRFFQNQFRKKDAHSPEELACEKAFYLMDCMHEESKYLGMQEMYSLLQNPKTVSVLEESYQFTLHDYYKLNTLPIYFDCRASLREEQQKKMDEMQASIAECNGTISSLHAIIAQNAKDIGLLQNAVLERNHRINAIENSIPMRLAKPIICLKNRIKGIKPARPVIYFMATHNDGNLGDHLTILRMYDFCRHYFPDYEIIELPARSYDALKSEFVAKIHNEDILIGLGGSYVSYKHLPFGEKHFRDFIQCFPDNRILIFPQPLYFEDTEEEQEEMRKSAEIFSAHPHLTLCLSEKYSMQKAEGLYQCKKLFVPDIALFGEPYLSDKPRMNKGLYILRDDGKTALQEKDREKIKEALKKRTSKIEKADTQLDHFVEPEQREAEVQKLLDEYTRAKCVVTDRLHGMIFAALTQTPCVALDNCYHTVSGTYEWMQNLPYIKMAQSPDEVGERLDEVLKVPSPRFTNQNLMPYYKQLKDAFSIK